MTRAEALKEIDSLIQRLDEINERQYVLDMEARDIRSAISILEKVMDPIVPSPIIIVK
jgi:hypothetical protein